MHALVIKAGAVVIAAGLSAAGYSASGSSSAAGSAEAASTVSVTAVVPTYIVRPGDTLYGIAARFCGNGNDYHALAAASGIADPNRIYVGNRVVLSCHTVSAGPALGQSQSTDHEPDGDNDDPQGGNSVAANGQANIPGTIPAVYSYYGLELLWVGAGGSPAEEGVAACIAERESGGRVFATGAQGERGLWQIAPSHGALSSYDPGTNARAAVIISSNGTNWSQWTTAGACGV